MEEALKPARAGWQPEETEMLWQEIRAAAENGAPLRGVFERMGRTLGRKPNSVRNYYYMQLRDRGGTQARRAVFAFYRGGNSPSAAGGADGPGRGKIRPRLRDGAVRRGKNADAAVSE